MWWGEFIDCLQFQTRPSSPLNFGMAYGKRNLRAVFARPFQQEEYHLVTDLGELHSHTKQVLTWVAAALTVGQFKPRRNLAEKEWSNGTEFSGYSHFSEYWDNLVRYTKNFEMRFRKMFFPFALPPGIFGRMESGVCL